MSQDDKPYGDKYNKGGKSDPIKSRGFKDGPRGASQGRGDKPAGKVSRGFRDKPSSDVRPRPPRERSDAAPMGDEAPAQERIAKRLARAGVASRRQAEALIVDGRVTVNGVKLTTPAFTVGEQDAIEIDGKPIPQIERTRLWLYHKPGGLVTSNNDPQGRPTVFERLPKDLPRVMSVGRLDINTEGLLLLTNDGGLARVLELPQTGWLRRYRVRAHGRITQAKLDTLKDGIAVDGVFYGAIEATLEREQGANAWMEIALREGKNREVKNVLGALGLEVNRLIRISYGPFQLGALEPGSVLEVRGKTLRDQLGDRLIEESGANFEAPVVHAFPNHPVSQRDDKRIAAAEAVAAAKPKRTGDWVSGSRSEGAPSKGAGKGAGARKTFEKSGDKRQKTLDKWSTDKNGPDDEQDKAKKFGRASRGANVWMAPGARPEGAKKIRERNEGAPSERNRDRSENPRANPNRPVRKSNVKKDFKK